MTSLMWYNLPGSFPLYCNASNRKTGAWEWGYFNPTSCAVLMDSGWPQSIHVNPKHKIIAPSVHQNHHQNVLPFLPSPSQVHSLYNWSFPIIPLPVSLFPIPPSLWEDPGNVLPILYFIEHLCNVAVWYYMCCCAFAVLFVFYTRLLTVQCSLLVASFPGSFTWEHWHYSEGRKSPVSFLMWTWRNQERVWSLEEESTLLNQKVLLF